MDPFFARNRLSAYIDGSLNAEDARRVEDAIAEDAALREEYEGLRQAVELLRTAGPADAPSGFAERLQTRIGAEPVPTEGVVLRFLRPLRRVPLEAMALAAAALIVVVVVQDSGGNVVDDPTPAVSPEVKPSQEANDAALEEHLKQLSDKSNAPPPSEPTPPEEQQAEAAPPMQTKGASKLQAKTPDEPYKAGWEQGAEVGNDRLDGDDEAYGGFYNGTQELRTTTDVALTTSDASALLKLSELASGFGGSVRGADLRVLDATDSTARIQVWIPTAAATDAQAQLERMGGVLTSAPATIQGSVAIFVVSVSYQTAP